MAQDKGGLTFFGIVKWTVAVAAMIVVFVGIAYRISGLQKDARADGQTTTTTGERLSTEDRELFFDLLKAKLLIPRKDGGLDQAPSDYLLIKRAKGDKSAPEGTTQSEQERLLKALYYSTPGVIVRQQVGLWNETRRVAGIRDDRDLADNDRNRTFWKAYSPSNHPLAVGDLVPETFGFIHTDGVSTGFGRWITVASQSKLVTFRTRVQVSTSQTLTVQVVGDPVKVPDGARVIRREVKFHEEKAVWPCAIPTRAAIVRIPVRATRAGTPLSITVRPAVNCDPRVYGLAIRMQSDPEQVKKYIAWKRALKSRNKRRREAAEANPVTVAWKYEWRPVERAKKGGGSFTISTADGVLLTDPNGRAMPSERAYDLGIASLVGFGPADASSLIGILGKSKLPPGGLNVTLTIDSRIQRIAKETVAHYLGTVFPKMSGGKFADERKSAVVILDANSGEILAVAGWPLPPKNATAWDYTSFAAENPLRDPMSIFAWEVIDKHNTPGSTFKPLLSLALMRAQRARINRIMKGMLPGELAAATSLAVGTGTYTIPGTTKSISNFGRSPLTGYFGRVSRNAQCNGGPVAADPRFGLTQAVQFSINMWFARLAVMLEEEQVWNYVAGVRAAVKAKKAPKRIFSLPPTNLMKSLRLVGIDDEKRMDLAINVPKSFGLWRFQSETGADILYAQTPRTHITSGEAMDTYNPDAIRVGYLHRIALNGIGQGWSVAPLHMARGAGSIASGKRIQPHIFKRWGDYPLPSPPAEELKVDREVLNVLRAGMKAVPEAPGSTAVGTFSAPPTVVDGKSGTALRDKQVATRLAKIRATLKCRSYGKTGTADIGRGLGYNSGWFVGWKDPLVKGGRTLAFSCMTTHAIGGFRFGGTSCGRIIRDILTSIEYLEMADLERKNGGANGAKPKKTGAPGGDGGDRDPGALGPR